VSKPRCGSLVILYEVLLCSCFDQKVHQQFCWQNIICRCGVPRKIIVDNAKQFNCHIFKDFCHQMGVKAAFTSVYHPQSNGEVEKANTLILTAIKMILEDQPKGIWAEELPGEVWCHNTFVCRLTKFTPLSCCMEKSP
jgi:transposase InsO family protein